MALPIGPIIGTLADNLRLRKSVMPMSKRRLTKWADGLDIPHGGDTILYTGHLYQMMPSISAMESRIARFEDNHLVQRMMGVGRFINRFVNTSAFMSHPSAKEQEIADGRLRNIARLLQAANISFGYLYEEEQYAGALVCDLGVESVFRAHAKQLYAMLKKNKVRRVITVDPHTTDMLASVYPTFIDDYDLEVKSYLEVLAESALAAKRRVERKVVIHDSCVYARYLGVLNAPRVLLERSGASIMEHENSQKKTLCCGGPIESLYPSKAKAISEKRVEQLKSGEGEDIVTMCPICLLNLQGAADDDTSIRDISEHLAEAFCEK